MSTSLEQSTLHLVGFRIEPDIHEPQLYTVYVDGDRPIMRQGQPLVFGQADLAKAALDASDCGAAALCPPTELYTVFDIAETVHTLSEKNEEAGSEVLDVINVLLDFANCVRVAMPQEYRSALEALADHLTFNKSFGEFLTTSGIQRTTVIDAIYWSLGMIVYNMKVIGPQPGSR